MTNEYPKNITIIITTADNDFVMARRAYIHIQVDKLPMFKIIFDFMTTSYIYFRHNRLGCLMFNEKFLNVHWGGEKGGLGKIVKLLAHKTF